MTGRRFAAVLAAVSLCSLAVGCTPDSPSTPTPTSAAPTTAAPTSSPRTATAPVTSASANQSTSASPSASASGPTVAGIPELIKTYCTATQKRCFHYPIGFTVTSEKTMQVPGGGESGQLLDPQGKPVLYFDDGIGGLGGGCGDESKKDNTIVNVAPTKLAGLPAQGTQGTTASAVQAVVPNEEGSFSEHQFLSADTRYAKAGTVKDCGLFFSNIIMLGENRGAVHLADHPFSSPAKATSYASVEEAKKAFATPTSQLVSAILQTATLG